MPGSLKFNRHDYPSWYRLNNEFRYSLSLYAGKHERGDDLSRGGKEVRKVSLGLTATGERRWLGIQVRGLTLYRASPVVASDDVCSEEASDRPGRWVFKGVDSPAHGSEEIGEDADGRLLDIDVVQPTSATTFDPHAFAELRKWVDECTQTHALCKVATSGQNSLFGYQQSIRLVDIGLGDDSSIRLVEGFKVNEVRYNTLSYQWTADTPKTSLRKHNKAAYCNAIPTENWPKVYKDVVVVCRALGVRYVWIDSLCIIQDDLEDWKVQSSMMQDIYSHGHVNLANLLGKYAGGLEVRRGPTGSTSPCILSRTLPDGSQEHWGCIEKESWREQIQDAPLYTRGWCYQERFLSARTVQFGQQLYWECRERFATEVVPDSKAFYDMNHPDLITSFGKDGENVGSLSPHEIWDTVVKIYTTTQLTQQSDKLVALRGVFNRFWERFEAEAQAKQPESNQQASIDWCIAGLWKRDLIRHLLWRRETYHLDSIPNPESWPSDDEQFHARAAEVLQLYPSWSWAACPSYLGFGICFTTQPTDKVEDMIVIEQIVPHAGGASTARDYTAFDSSSLILRGLLYEDISAIDMDAVFAEWRTKSESSGMVKDHAQLLRRSAWWIHFDRPLPSPPPKPENVGVLMVRVVGLGEVKQTRWMHGLLVELLGEGEDGLSTYRRMGFFLLRSKKGLIPGVEWPERFETGEEVDAAVREVREGRGTWPLLRLV